MKFKYGWLFLAVIMLLFNLCAPAVHAQTTPHSFHGTVSLNGQPAPVGTTVSAKVKGVFAGKTTVVEAGEYGGDPDPTETALVVQGTHFASGDRILFYVNGFRAPQTHLFQSGADTTDLNLTATVGVTDITDVITPEGVTTEPVTVQSSDTIAEVEVPADTQVTVVHPVTGIPAPVTTITFVPITPPAPPPGNSVAFA